MSIDDRDVGMMCVGDWDKLLTLQRGLAVRVERCHHRVTGLGQGVGYLGQQCVYSHTVVLKLFLSKFFSARIMWFRENSQELLMARKVSCCALGDVVVLFHVQPGRYQLSFADLLSEGSFHKENISPDIRPLSQTKNETLDFGPSDITRQWLISSKKTQHFI